MSEIQRDYARVLSVGIWFFGASAMAQAQTSLSVNQERGKPWNINIGRAQIRFDNSFNGTSLSLNTFGLTYDLRRAGKTSLPIQLFADVFTSLPNEETISDPFKTRIITRHQTSAMGVGVSVVGRGGPVLFARSRYIGLGAGIYRIFTRTETDAYSYGSWLPAPYTRTASRSRTRYWLGGKIFTGLEFRGGLTTELSVQLPSYALQTAPSQATQTDYGDYLFGAGVRVGYRF